MKWLSRLNRKVTEDHGLPLLLALYAWGGFLILTHFLSQYWEIYSTRCCGIKILLHISLFVSLSFVFGSKKLRHSKGTPRGIIILSIFCGINIAYWWGEGTSQPVLYGPAALFAGLLIFIDWAHIDWKRKYDFGVLPRSEDKYEYKSKLEFLKILQSSYSWYTKVCVYMFVAIAFATSWEAAQIAIEHHDFYPQVKWAMIGASYISVGDLLIALLFLRATLKRIEREILELKEHNNSNN